MVELKVGRPNGSIFLFDLFQFEMLIEGLIDLPAESIENLLCQHRGQS
jgi:hypothetical protein